MSLISQNKGKNLFIFVFLFSLFFISLVSGQQPPPAPQTNVNIDIGFDIDFPKVTVFELNEDFNFNFHVFNRSDGLRLDNSSVNCSLHVFNKTGSHIFIDDNVPFSLTFDDWRRIVEGGNFSILGQHSALVDCNDGTFGGFASFPFEVTPTGFSNLLGFYIILIGISLILLVLGFWIKDAWVTILGTFGLYFVGLYILLNGIVGIRDLAYTRTIAIIILAVAAYISYKAAQEVVNG